MFCPYLLQSYEDLSGHGIVFAEKQYNLIFPFKMCVGYGGGNFLIF